MIQRRSYLALGLVVDANANENKFTSTVANNGNPYIEKGKNQKSLFGEVVDN